jgi:F-type H+-transporting ATPase subunit a
MTPVLASTITIGNHWRPFSFNINMDDVLASLVAGLIVIGMGTFLASRVTSGVPGRLQSIYESIIDAISRQASRSMGDRARPVIPLVVTLFLYILIANWLEMIPTQPTDSGPQYLPAPTGDVNQTYALALLVIVGVHFAAVRTRGAKGYVKHYFKPYPALFPINVIEEIAKPVTLALRLFGNIFAGGLMLLLFAGLFSSYIVPLPDVIWKMFDGLFVGPIQAFIFSLLTLLYFETAMSHDH